MEFKQRLWLVPQTLSYFHPKPFIPGQTLGSPACVHQRFGTLPGVVFCLTIHERHPRIHETHLLSQTVVDELSVATIVLESNPWHDDISQSLECNVSSSFRTRFSNGSFPRLRIQRLRKFVEPATRILSGVCL